MFQRIDQAGYPLPIDERILADTDTLMVFGLDHLLSEQEAAPDEIEAIERWLRREGTCLLLAPIMTSVPATTSPSGSSNTATTATPWCRASSDSGNTHAHR